MWVLTAEYYSILINKLKDERVFILQWELPRKFIFNVKMSFFERAEVIRFEKIKTDKTIRPITCYQYRSYLHPLLFYTPRGCLDRQDPWLSQ